MPLQKENFIFNQYTRRKNRFNGFEESTEGISHRPRNCVPGPAHICHVCRIPKHFRKNAEIQDVTAYVHYFSNAENVKSREMDCELPKRLTAMKQSVKAKKN